MLIHLLGWLCLIELFCPWPLFGGRTTIRCKSKICCFDYNINLSAVSEPLLHLRKKTYFSKIWLLVPLNYDKFDNAFYHFSEITAHCLLSRFLTNAKRSYNISRLNETNFTHQMLLEQELGDEHDAVECSCDGCRGNRPCLMTGMRAKRPESVFLYEIWNDIQALKRTHRGVFCLF